MDGQFRRALRLLRCDVSANSDGSDDLVMFLCQGDEGAGQRATGLSGFWEMESRWLRIVVTQWGNPGNHDLLN